MIAHLVRIFGIALVLLPFTAAAQNPNHCWIRYTYDAAGNRVERTWWCGDPNEAEHDPKMMTQDPFGLSLAPNPTRDRVTLTSDEELSNALVTLTTEDGRTKYSGNMSGNRADLDVSAYEAGFYVLTVRSGQVEFQQRFTVVH